MKLYIKEALREGLLRRESLEDESLEVKVLLEVVRRPIKHLGLEALGLLKVEEREEAGQGWESLEMEPMISMRSTK